MICSILTGIGFFLIASIHRKTSFPPSKAGMGRILAKAKARKLNIKNN